MIVGTAGHIDHGKTALVGALTGVDTDRLKEEKARGISIDLGFAYLPAPGGGVIGFVDVPGHEGFVHNMLAGAAGIDFALLVVAADDGVMPQTREHLAILDLLGNASGLVALTKTDLVPPERLAEVRTGIANLLAPTALGRAEILAVSSATGAGVDDLRARLFAAAGETGERQTSNRFRLAVDRSFTLSGVGTVVTGNVRSGAVTVGDRVVISPSGREARVRSIHAQDRPVERGEAGERCALNLAGDGVTKDSVHRGDFVLDPALHAPTDRIDATLRVLPTETRPLKQWTPVHLHHAAAEVPARVVLLQEDPIAPGGEAPVQLVLQKRIAAAEGDRYVIRDTSARRTIGGGVFLDLRAPSRRRRTPERLGRLEARALRDPAAALAALLERPPHHVDLLAFARDRALTDAELEGILARVPVVRLVGAKFALGLSVAAWDGLKAGLFATIAKFHEERPNQPGMDIERLRPQVEPKLPPLVFMAVLRALAKSGGISLEGARVRLAGHSVSLSPRDAALWERIEPLIAGDERYAPPRTRDIAKLLGAPEAEVRRILKLNATIGKITEVAQDQFFTRRALSEILDILVEFSDDLTVARVRDRLASGRKIAIAVLEWCDRQALTARHGDVRRVNLPRIERFRSALGGGSDGGEAFPVERPDFKSGRGREPVFGGFDSHSLPPDS